MMPELPACSSSEFKSIVLLLRYYALYTLQYITIHYNYNVKYPDLVPESWTQNLNYCEPVQDMGSNVSLGSHGGQLGSFDWWQISHCVNIPGLNGDLSANEKIVSRLVISLSANRRAVWR